MVARAPATTQRLPQGDGPRCSLAKQAIAAGSLAWRLAEIGRRSIDRRESAGQIRQSVGVRLRIVAAMAVVLLPSIAIASMDRLEEGHSDGVVGETGSRWLHGSMDLKTDDAATWPSQQQLPTA